MGRGWQPCLHIGLLAAAAATAVSRAQPAPGSAFAPESASASAVGVAFAEAASPVRRASATALPPVQSTMRVNRPAI